MIIVDKKRIKAIKAGHIGDGPILYLMSREHRFDNNWSLLYAQELALSQKQPLIAACPVAIDYPDAFPRQINFLKSGLRQVSEGLEDLNIPFIGSMKQTVTSILNLIKKIQAGAIVSDFNPLRESQKWKKRLSDKINIPFYEVDAHNIVPCWEVSNKQEYAAYTIRPKINKKLSHFLTEMPKLKKHPFAVKNINQYILSDWSNPAKSKIKAVSDDRLIQFKSGGKAAQKQLQAFLNKKMVKYNENRNDPNTNGQSDLSPYIHFGQLSAQQVALETQRFDSNILSQEAFLEELIIRRELSDNFCFYNKNYDTFDGFPKWAQKTLDEHRNDPRPYLYDRDTLESADTHDELWNTAQQEMVMRGKMHGYMRMYWAKKILEWSPTPEIALESAIYLNNKYELDGNDPNGYAGVAWSIGGVHDRAWSEREIFGKIRFMSYNGCKRKFSISDYVNKFNNLKLGENN